MTELNFTKLGLSGQLLRALKDAGYEAPTPIQAKAIPLLLKGCDLLGIAQTGTGKTAAFTLPLLHKLGQKRKWTDPHCARALILAPTRELVIQISKSLKTYGRHLKLQQTVVMGGVSQRPQIKTLKRGTDILVATPGRLLDLVKQGHADLSQTEYLILDEADRMLDMGFIRDVRRIVADLPSERQTLLFSATMPKEVAKLANEVLNDPQRIEIAAKSVAVDRIDQQVHYVAATHKRARLAELLAAPEMERVIVFTRTKHGADKVVKHLKRDDISAEAIHGNKTQGARQRSLENFRAGRIRVLVATDIASRGIDIDEVTHVINYELPNEPESYVHRIGRTARAGASGTAISLCAPAEQPHLRAIERLLKRPLTIAAGEPIALTSILQKQKKGNGDRPKARSPRRRRRPRRQLQRAA